jgi:ubiquinone/menaquinone biosynthesis C-methylase UbiE
MGKAGAEISSAERRYDRIAWFYDWMDAPMERFGTSEWRTNLFSRLEGRCILEVGVGTGKNLKYYPAGKEVVGIDVSGRMLDRARKKAAGLKSDFTLLKMDVQKMNFPDASFDAVVSTCVFCSVPDPVKGLQEVRRVLKPGGKAFFLEHVRPSGLLGWIFDFMSPLIAHAIGPSINRDTVGNTRKAGFHIIFKENLFSDIFKLVIAKV